MKSITCQMKFEVFATGGAMHLFAKAKASWRIWLYIATGKERRIHIHTQTGKLN
jgi:hypothetical protein